MVTGTSLVFFTSVGIVIPTDELIFFRGVGQPPTRYIYIYIGGVRLPAILFCTAWQLLRWRDGCHNGEAKLVPLAV